MRWVSLTRRYRASDHPGEPRAGRPTAEYPQSAVTLWARYGVEQCGARALRLRGRMRRLDGRGVALSRVFWSGQMPR